MNKYFITLYSFKSIRNLSHIDHFRTCELQQATQSITSVFVVSSAVASVVIVAAVCEVALASGGDGSSRVAENRWRI